MLFPAISSLAKSGRRCACTTLGFIIGLRALRRRCTCPRCSLPRPSPLAPGHTTVSSAAAACIRNPRAAGDLEGGPQLPGGVHEYSKVAGRGCEAQPANCPAHECVDDLALNRCRHRSGGGKGQAWQRGGDCAHQHTFMAGCAVSKARSGCMQGQQACSCFVGTKSGTQLQPPQGMALQRARSPD